MDVVAIGIAVALRRFGIGDRGGGCLKDWGAEARMWADGRELGWLS